MTLAASRIAVLALLAGIMVARLKAQPAPAFDAASVRLADGTTMSGGRGGPGTSDPGRMTYGHVDLILLLAKAYGMQRDQIVVLPPCGMATAKVTALSPLCPEALPRNSSG